MKRSPRETRFGKPLARLDPSNISALNERSREPRFPNAALMVPDALAWRARVPRGRPAAVGREGVPSPEQLTEKEVEPTLLPTQDSSVCRKNETSAVGPAFFC